MLSACTNKWQPNTVHVYIRNHRVPRKMAVVFSRDQCMKSYRVVRVLRKSHCMSTCATQKKLQCCQSVHTKGHHERQAHQVVRVQQNDTIGKCFDAVYVQPKTGRLWCLCVLQKPLVPNNESLCSVVHVYNKSHQVVHAQQQKEVTVRSLFVTQEKDTVLPTTATRILLSTRSLEKGTVSSTK